MLRYFRFILAAFSAMLLLDGCAGSSPEVVAKIGNESLTLPEFEESYAKNNGGWDKAVTSTMDERQKFLDLLVKFRLKVKEAKERGLMQDSTIRSELDGYTVSVATSYMLDKEIVQPRIKELYDRTTVDLRASHILIRLSADPTPDDTLAAYKKALSIIQQIPTTPFDTLAVRYSEEPGANISHGDVGYVPVGKMVPEFEDACFALKVGEYTHLPVRTQFGYHIIKVTARQPSKGAVRISHILRRFVSPQDSTVVKDSVDFILKLLHEGMDFALAAKQFSQDPGSATNAGDIGYYSRGQLPPNIEQMFFDLPVDSVSAPLRMPYGYHIFKNMGFKPPPAFSDVEKEIREQYQQNRYNKDYDSYVEGLKKRYTLSVDDAAVNALARSFDTTANPSVYTWSDTLTNDMKKKILFRCQGRPFTVADFVEYVNNSAEFKGEYLFPKNVQHMVERMEGAKLVEENARLVPAKYPAFNKLLKEYQDGILLYRVEQDEVWKKVVVNDSLLKLFYDENKEKYRWPERVSFAEVYATTDSVINAAYAEIKAGKDFEEVAERYTMRPGYKEKKGVWSLTPVKDNPVAEYAASLPVNEVSGPYKHTMGWSIVKVLAKDSSHVKSFQEATPELMSAYQEFASKERMDSWVQTLKERYPVVVNNDVLMQAFKRKPVAEQ